MKRVAVYVDGYNLYFGLRERGWKRFYWLNIHAMAANLLKSDQVLAATHYFTTVVRKPDDKRRRQMVYLEALQTIPALQIHYGHFLSDTIVCRRCGHSYETHHEKMTDVNIAVELLTGTYQDVFDVALLVSADSDLVAPVEAVQTLFPAKRVVVAFPPERSSKALMKVASAHFPIGRSILAKSLFPDEVVKSDGFVLRRPVEWQ